jgi:hypothetical protein
MTHVYPKNYSKGQLLSFPEETNTLGFFGGEEPYYGQTYSKIIGNKDSAEETAGSWLPWSNADC